MVCICMEKEGRTYQDIVVTELRQRDIDDAVRLWLLIAGTTTYVSHIRTNNQTQEQDAYRRAFIV